MFSFDWTVNVGNILTLLALFGTALISYVKLNIDLNILKHDFDAVKKSMGILSDSVKGISEILTKVAVQEERLLNLSKDIDELRHGKGFIK